MKGFFSHLTLNTVINGKGKLSFHLLFSVLLYREKEIFKNIWGKEKEGNI